MTFKFETVDMKTEIVNGLKNELPKFGFNRVKILKADPLTDAEIPCIGVNRISDDENNQSIADGQGTFYDKSSKEWKEFYGTFFQESMEIRVWHLNADERDRLYIHTKAILFALRKELVKKGVINITLRSGRDEQDTTLQQASVPLYWATITMSYLNPLDVAFIETVEPISFVLPRNLVGGEEGGGQE